jgi:hypothetical protein
VSDFFIEMPNLSTKLLERARLGMGQAGMQLMSDASIELPTTPHKTGRLRGSGSTFVGKKLQGVSPDNSVLNNGTPATVNSMPLEDEKEFLVATVGFNTEYATIVHEGVHLNFSQPGAGAKFLEKKAVERKDLYMRIVANNMRRG